MNNPSSDLLTIVNGPEDGAEFPVVKRTVRVGSDPASEINVLLDRRVDAGHAVLSAVSHGYRVRRGGRFPVWVNGKTAGKIRSRMLRQGGTLQVGNSVLYLHCAPDGLANKSRGALADTDAVHLLGSILKPAAGLAGGVFHGLAAPFLRVFAKFVAGLAALACAGALLYYLLPRAVPFVRAIALWLSQIRHMFQ